MGGKQTRFARRGNDIALSHTTTDSPLLPIDQLEKLQTIAPSRVDWVFEQTQIESEFRRSEARRVNLFVFIERISGLVFALLIAVLGLSISTYLALQDKVVVASIIGGTTLVGLVTTFVVGKNSKESSE